MGRDKKQESVPSGYSILLQGIHIYRWDREVGAIHRQPHPILFLSSLCEIKKEAYA